VTALYEIEPRWSRDGFIGTVRLRWLDPDTNFERELTRDIDLFAMGDDFASTGTGFRLAAAVAGFAEILRESPYATGYTLGDVSREARELAAIFRRADVDEFAQLAADAARLSGSF
jgi:Ca-activated chloride channel family protein